ncbi:MAG: MFS transporter [Actinomycetota bacterium]|nr:MFS transporter [Actinomycetota bacterium]
MRVLSRDRNFTLLWIGQTLSEVGSQVTTIAMPLLVLALTGSAAKAGLVGVARMIALPLVSLPAGVIADRGDRRHLMIACAAGRLVATASVAVALAVGRPGLAQLMAVALIDAGLYSVATVAERGLIGEIVPDALYADAVAVNEGREAAAYTAGPPLGGALFGLARALPFLADTVSFLAALATLAVMRRPAPGRSSRLAPGVTSAPPALGRGLRGAIGEAREGMSWLWRHPFLRAGALLYAVANVSVGALELLGLLIARHHGASSSAIGGAFAVVGAAGLLGAAVAGPLRRRVSTRVGVLAEIWFDALLTPGLFLAHSPIAIGLLLGLMVVPMTMSTSIVVGARMTFTPDRMRGRVQASSGLLSSSLAWLGPLAVGVLFQYAGETVTVAVVSGWALILAVGATGAPSLRTIPQPDVASGSADAPRRL